MLERYLFIRLIYNKDFLISHVIAGKKKIAPVNKQKWRPSSDLYWTRVNEWE